MCITGIFFHNSKCLLMLRGMKVDCVGDVAIEGGKGLEVKGNCCGGNVTCDVAIEVVEGVEVNGNGCGSDVTCDVSIEVVKGVEVNGNGCGR